MIEEQITHGGGRIGTQVRRKNRMLEKLKMFKGRIMTYMAIALLSVQSFAQTTGLALPSDTETKLTGIIEGSFGVVIGVVVVVVAAGLLIKLIRKAG